MRLLLCKSIIECNFCHSKIHAVNCSTNKDICSASFLQSFKKINSKDSGFTFLCDVCLTSCEVSRVDINSKKTEENETTNKQIGAIQEQISLQTAISQINNKLEQYPAKSDCGENTSTSKQICWSLLSKSNTTERSIDNSEASNGPFTSADKPVLVIESYGSTTENESTSILEKTVVNYFKTLQK